MKVVQIIGFLWSFSKNKEPNTISCINSIKNWGNRIIDVGSTANTTEIAKTSDAESHTYVRIDNNGRQIKKAIIVSLKFHPGHVSHLVASYKQCEELGYEPYFYVNEGFKSFLPKNSNVLVYGKDKVEDVKLIVLTFPHPLNIRLILSTKIRQTKILYIFHEPLTKYSVYRKAGFSIIQMIKLIVGDLLECITVKLADAIILPSLKAVNYYMDNRLYVNRNFAYIPLMYNDECEKRHEEMPRLYFSYIGTVAADHSFNEYMDFVCWAIRENKLPNLKFLIATKSEFRVPQELSKSPRVTIHKGTPMSDDEINAFYASTYVVWNAYVRTTQSGVLAKSFMFGTPALVLRQNCNEFAQDEIEVKAINSNKNFEEIELAINCIISNFDKYSESCRDQFMNSFYYRKYNERVRSLLESKQ